METGRLMHEHGLSPDDAWRRALAAFGGVENHKEPLRAIAGSLGLAGCRSS